MQINWFEIIAQMINFFILIFLLHKLFYKPVINAMEERQERIAEDQNKAEARMQEANELIKNYENKMADIEGKKNEILEEAEKNALNKREKLIEKYKIEAEDKRNDFLKDIQEEKEHFLNELRKSLGKNAVRIASNILNTLSKEELKDKVFHSFIDKVVSLDQDTLQDEISSTDEHLLLISSEEISQQKRKVLEEKLKEKLGVYKNISYEIDEDLILGYELKLETLTVHTNMNKYLEEAEKNIIKTLEKKSL